MRFFCSHQLLPIDLSNYQTDSKTPRNTHLFTLVVTQFSPRPSTESKLMYYMEEILELRGHSLLQQHTSFYLYPTRENTSVNIFKVESTMQRDCLRYYLCRARSLTFVYANHIIGNSVHFLLVLSILCINTFS